MTGLGDLDGPALASLGREYLLAGHLIDRAGMPPVIARYGREVMGQVAIDEWVGASPVYTRRMQRLLGFEGDDVPTIFKGMQLDIGAPHEFMDFRFRVLDPHHGEFWLACCGALMDVEPMGEDFVLTMCHDIEDPTFDATAGATNPRARVRPVHRPPRVPADRTPHCQWTVVVDETAEPLPQPERAARLSESRAASLPIVPVRLQGDEVGLVDYAGPFDPDLRLERFAPSPLRTLVGEFALQGQLLARSFMTTLADRFGVDVAQDIGHQEFVGIAGLTARRLTRWLGGPTGLAGVARVLQLHPAFHPRAYVDTRIEGGADGDDEVRLTIGDSPALSEGDDLTWAALLVHGDARPLEAIVQAVDPRASVRRTADGIWSVTLDPGAEPAPEPDEVAVTLFSTGADFSFRKTAAGAGPHDTNRSATLAGPAISLGGRGRTTPLLERSR